MTTWWNMDKTPLNFRFPDGIDEPKLIFFWEVPVFLTAFMLGSIGFIIQNELVFVAGFAGAFYLLRFFRRQLENQKRNLLFHTLYSIGWVVDKVLARFPPSFKNFTGR